MKPTTLPTPAKQSVSVRRRQIGRKALQADRLARALNASRSQKSKKLLRLPSVQPKILAGTLIAVAIVGIAGITGSQLYMANAAKTERAAAAELQKQLQAQSAAADACRQQKVQQKADQLGKITYDELYDYDSCDK